MAEIPNCLNLRSITNSLATSTIDTNSFYEASHKLDISKLDFVPLFTNLFQRSELGSRGFSYSNIKSHFSKFIPDFDYEEDYEDVLDSAVEFVVKNQTFNRYINLRQHIIEAGNKYERLYSCIQNRRDYSFNIKGHTIEFFNQTCVDRFSGKVLFSLGIKKEFIEYVILSREYGSSIDPFAFKIVVDDEFYNNPKNGYSLKLLSVVKSNWIHADDNIDVEFVDGKDLYRDMLVSLNKFSELKTVNRSSIRKISDFCTSKNIDFLQFKDAQKRLKTNNIKIVN